MAIKIVNIGFEYLDILVKGFAENKDMPIFFAVATRARCSSEPKVATPMNLLFWACLVMRNG